MREGVMPGVAPEKHTFARLHPMDLTRLRIRNRHHPLEHAENLIRPENGPMVRGMPEGTVRFEPEHERMDELARDVDPVRNFPRLRVAPQMMNGRIPRDVGRLIKSRPRGCPIQARRGDVRWLGRALTSQSHKVIILS